MTARPRRRGAGDAPRDTFESARAALEDMAALLDAAPAAQAPGDPRLPVPALPSLLERCEAIAARTEAPRGHARLLVCFPGLEPLEPEFWNRHVPGARPVRLSRDLPGDIAQGARLAARARAAAQRAIRAEAGRDGYDVLMLAEAGPTLPGEGEDTLVLVCHPRQAWRAHLADHRGAALSYGAFCRVLDRATQGAGILRHEDLPDDPEAMRTALCARLGLPAPLRLRRPPALPEAPRLPGLLPPLRPDETELHDRLCARLGYDPQAPLPRPAPAPTPRRARRSMSDRPDARMILACHHKSGTNFLRNVFQELAKRFDLRMWMKFYDAEPAAGWDLCMHQHGRIGDVQFGRNFRGVHCVRHPMALIQSAAVYHQKCSELWVDVPLERFTEATFRALSDRETWNTLKATNTSPERRREIMSANPAGAFDSGYDFAGRSYRQMLEGFSDMADKLCFEMRGFSYGVVRDMARFPKDARFFQITLEEISHDPSMDGLERMFRHLGFAGQPLQTCLDVAATQCLWNRKDLPGHATSGVSRSWETAFQGRAEAEFRALFGWPDDALGYTRPRSLSVL